MKSRVLVIDDDEAITRQLYWTLSDAYEVMTANDPESAVRRALLYEPDVSIVDLHLLPTVNSAEIGLRMIEYLKSRVPWLKVLVISSADGIDDQKASYAAGADDFLDKPFETEQLIAVMRRMAPPRHFELV